jgi:hypothetical protein
MCKGLELFRDLGTDRVVSLSVHNPQ